LKTRPKPDSCCCVPNLAFFGNRSFALPGPVGEADPVLARFRQTVPLSPRALDHASLQFSRCVPPAAGLTTCFPPYVLFSVFLRSSPPRWPTKLPGPAPPPWTVFLRCNRDNTHLWPCAHASWIFQVSRCPTTPPDPLESPPPRIPSLVFNSSALNPCPSLRVAAVPFQTPGRHLNFPLVGLMLPGPPLDPRLKCVSTLFSRFFIGLGVMYQPSPPNLHRRQ